MPSSYGYFDAAKPHTHAYLWPKLREIIMSRQWPKRRAFDIGCGNGATCNMLAELGFEVTGIDTSESGIAWANQAYPHIRAFVGDAYDDLAGKYGQYPLVVSLEVIEHCIDPRRFVATFLSLFEPGGVGVLSTPYHGYLKNLALAATGRMDGHFTALWDGGHIKFFSVATLRRLLMEMGATDLEFSRVGRIPALAKSMICVVRRGS